MLEAEQINQITTYCESRGVQYYDVQMELVDHLADMIENLQKANIILSFSEALEMTGKQFSDDEFKAIVNNKKNQLIGRFKRMWWEEFVSYFTVPKIAFTLLLVGLVVWLSFFLDDTDFMSMIMSSSYLVIQFCFVFYLSKTAKRILPDKFDDPTPNPLLLVSIKSLNKHYEMLSGIIVCTYCVLWGFNFAKKWTGFQTIQLIAFYVSPFAIISSLAIRKVYLEMMAKIRNQYPKAFTS